MTAGVRGPTASGAPADEREPEVAREKQPAYVKLFLAALVLNIFSGTSGVLLYLPLSPDRPLFLLALVLLALDPRTERLHPRANHAVMALMVLWVFFSWFFTGSLLDSYKLFAFSDRVVLPLLMFLVGPLIFRDTATRTLLLKTLAVVGLYLGLTGLFEITDLRFLVFPSGINNPELGILYGRARGPFLSSEPMGMATTIIAVSSAVLAVRSRGRWRPFGALVAVLCTATSVASLTRSVWLGGVLAAITCVAAVPALRRRTPAIVAGIAALVVLVAVALPSFTEMVTNRAETSRSVYDRLLTNDAALRILDYHPLFGIGWGRFLDVTDLYVRQAGDYPLTNTRIIVHNVFLSLAADTGIAGAVLWGLAMLTGPVAVVVARMRRTPEMQGWRLIALCSIWVWLVPTLTSPNPYPFPNNLVWLVGGIAGYQMLVRRQDPDSAGDTDGEAVADVDAVEATPEDPVGGGQRPPAPAERTSPTSRARPTTSTT